VGAARGAQQRAVASEKIGDLIEAGTYRNSFGCVREAVAIVPRAIAAPQAATALGPQTAIVVGAPGAVATTTRDHQVRIQFAWQRGQGANPGGIAHDTDAKGSAPGDDSSGTWVRVAEALAGPNWGSHSRRASAPKCWSISSTTTWTGRWWWRSCTPALTSRRTRPAWTGANHRHAVRHPQPQLRRRRLQPVAAGRHAGPGAHAAGHQQRGHAAQPGLSHRPAAASAQRGAIAVPALSCAPTPGPWCAAPRACC
jgi:hypothetical protein